MILHEHGQVEDAEYVDLGPPDVTPLILGENVAVSPAAEPLPTPNLSDMEPVVSATGLTVRFGAQNALDAVDFDIFPGMVAAFVGPSGSGAATALRAILGLTPVASGALLVGGVDLGDRDLDRRALRRRVGGAHMSQSVFGHCSAYDNVALALESADMVVADSVVRALLSRVGLSAQSKIEANALSDEDRRRLAVARMLAYEPAALVFDTSAAGVRPGELGALSDVIATLADDGVAWILAAESRAEVAPFADEIHMMSEGVFVDVERRRSPSARTLAYRAA